MRITFVLPTLGHPRHRKRIRALRRLGAKVRVLAFERDGQLGDTDESVETLGAIANEEYLRRLGTYARATALIRSAARDSDAVYTFGTDLLGLVRAATVGLRGLQLAAEVGDIPGGLLGPSVRARLVRMTERRILAGDVLLVATSPPYVEQFYRGVQGLPNLRTLIIENKVDPDVTLPPASNVAREAGAPLRIGWFGLLRCEQSWRVLRRLADEAGDRVRIELRGIAFDRLAGLAAEAAARPNVTWHGRYSVPTDLPEMFSGVDLCWMVHHDLERPYENWGWARSNRLYQAGWYRTPLIAQEGKDDSNVVRQHDLGLVLDISKGRDAFERLLEISDEDLRRWRTNIEAAPLSLFALTDEHEQLLAALAGQVPASSPEAGTSAAFRAPRSSS